MKMHPYAELMNILREYRTVARNVPSTLLRHTVSLASEAGDFWARSQIIRWLAHIRQGESEWIPTLREWLLNAATRRSPWTIEMVFDALKGWPHILKLDWFTDVARAHPGAVADALIRALDFQVINDNHIPVELVQSLASSALLAGGHAPGKVAALLSKLYPGDKRWGDIIRVWLEHPSARESKVDILDALMNGWPERVEYNQVS